MTLVLGWLVGIIDVAQFVPQTRRAMALRRVVGGLAGLSVTTWTIATIQATAWVVYGFAERLYAIAVPNVLIAPACAAILLARLRQRPVVREEHPDPHGGPL